MEMVKIKVQHSRSFIDHCEQDDVFECEVPVGTTAEDLFCLFNQDVSEIRSDDMFWPVLAAYRAKRLRSLSVGDRLVMNGHILAVRPVGFEPV